MSLVDDLKASEATVASASAQTISELEATVSAKTAEWEAHIEALSSCIVTATTARDKLSRALENLKVMDLSNDLAPKQAG